MLFITVEGKDGAGKGVQAKLLIDHLTRLGHEVASFDFPQYDRPSSHFVRRYLNGDYGSLAEVGPKRASVLYAVDRFDAADEMRAALEAGKIVVSNRYVASNMAHQGSKFEDPQELEAFFRWLYELEYEIMGIPRPDLNIILHVSAQAGDLNVSRKGKREYLRKGSKDLHESDPEHLRRSAAVYDLIAAMHQDQFRFINCMTEGVLMSPQAVHERIWGIVEPLVFHAIRQFRADHGIIS